MEINKDLNTKIVECDVLNKFKINGTTHEIWVNDDEEFIFLGRRHNFITYSIICKKDELNNLNSLIDVFNSDDCYETPEYCNRLHLVFSYYCNIYSSQYPNISEKDIIKQIEIAKNQVDFLTEYLNFDKIIELIRKFADVDYDIENESKDYELQLHPLLNMSCLILSKEDKIKMFYQVYLKELIRFYREKK